MKVKYDYQIFGTQKYGGISKYFFYLAKELNKTEIEAKIIAPLYVSNIIKDFIKNYIFKYIFIS